LISGLVTGAHGVAVMPDLTLSDLEGSSKITSYNVVLLPENDQGLNKLETDPRLHKLLCQVIAQKGQIAIGSNWMRFLRKLPLGDVGAPGSSNGNEPLLLLREPGQSIEVFAHILVRRLEQPSRF
jgi:hypothetical protein